MSSLALAAAAALLAGTATALIALPVRRAASGIAPHRRLALGLGVPAAAIALYLWIGDPAAVDGERERLSQALSSGALARDPVDAERFAAELQRHLARHPDDARAAVMQARLDMAAQRHAAAAEGFARALEGRSKTAGDAGVWVEYAEALALAQGGTLTGKPRELIAKALALDPDHPQALDLAGSAAWEAGDFAQAASHWQHLLKVLPADESRRTPLQAAIARAEQRARFALPPR